MKVDFPPDERSLRYIEAIEDAPDIKAIISILPDKRKQDFYNYASILTSLMSNTFLASFAPKHVVLQHLKSFFPRRDISQINVLGADELQNL